MDIYWDGIASEEGLGEDLLRLRHTFADLCRDNDWGLVFLFVKKYKYSGLINGTRPGGNTKKTPLHHAAQRGAEPSVVRRLVELGALRTLQDSKGDRPVDLAMQNGYGHLKRGLTPVIHHDIPVEPLSELEESFHAVIRDLFMEFRVRQQFHLPLLEPLLELKVPRMCFHVDEMWGGFVYKLKRAGTRPLLISEYRNRMCESGNLRHEIWLGGSRLIKKGFR